MLADLAIPPVDILVVHGFEAKCQLAHAFDHRACLTRLLLPRHLACRHELFFDNINEWLSNWHHSNNRAMTVFFHNWHAREKSQIAE